MKTLVLYLTVLGCTLANPNGYYHQEYNYKTSASSYRNNELQHQTDDQGYYRKDGDLEGRIRPKVDANSEHSEYVNPNLKNTNYHTGLVGGANGDLSSYGHMRANVGSYNAHDQSAEGLAHSDHISGAQGAYSGYSSGSYGSSSYGSGSQAYSVASNLGTMTSRVQQELERDLQRAVQENRAYSQNERLQISELERELRQNLTNRLNNELVNRYGQQSIRGGLSYTLSGGRLQSTANYDNQELLDLRRSMENTLLNQLRTQYNQVYSGSRYTYSTTTLKPSYYTHYPTTTYRPFTTIRPQYLDNSNYIRYTPVQNTESITTIVARVQNQLDSRLNQILEDVQRTHFSSSSSYALTNTEALLERLRNELRANITYVLEEEIRRSYGTQIQRDGYMYTIGSGGETSSQYNYSIRDLENLKLQIERNLIEKLNRDFERYRTSWYQQNKQYGQTLHSSSYGEYTTTPRYIVYTTPQTPHYGVYNTPLPQYKTYDAEAEHLSNRPSSNHLTSLITGGVKSSSQSNQYASNQYAASGQSGYEVSSSRGASQLQRQLQQDLSRQLQAAINRGHFGYYSSSGSYNPQSYQVSLQQLTDELNRNLTRQLQEYSSNSYYSTYGNIDQSQLASLRSQLQADLMRQLQQGLQQSYHSSSSYSASSSSSSGNYRPTRGFENYQLGQYKSGGNIALVQGEDCVGDDPNAYINHRMKRSYQPYRSQPIGLSYSGYGNSRYYNSYRNPPQELGQQIHNTVEVEDPGYELHPQNQQNTLGQQVDESDLTQQVENVELGSQRQQQIEEQPVENDQLTQQVEDDEFGRLQLGSQQSLQQIPYGQQVDNSDLTKVESQDLQLGSQRQQRIPKRPLETDDLTQQVEDVGFGKLQLGSQQIQEQIPYGQQVDNSDLTQQVESEDLQLDPQKPQQIQERPFENGHLTQQTEAVGFGKLQLGSQPNQEQTPYAQQVDNSDLTQQVENEDLRLGPQRPQQVQERPFENDHLTQQAEDVGFGKLQLGSQPIQEQTPYGQQVDNSDLTQQVENEGLHLGPQRPQQVQEQPFENDHLTQQTEDVEFGKLQLGSQPNQEQAPYGQQIDNSDLIQVERENLQLESQGQQQVEERPDDDSNLTQKVNDLRQVEDDGFGRLQLGSQHRIQETGQQEDTSDLTQQVEDSGIRQTVLTSQQGPEQLGSIRSPHRPETEIDQDLTQQQVENTGYGNLQFGSQQQVYRGDQDLTQRQSHLKLTKLVEDQLIIDLKNAIREKLNTNSYSGSTNIQRERLSQTLNNEIRTNITKLVQAIASGDSRFSYSYNFNNQQLNNLQRKLENDLKLEIEDELSSINRNIPSRNFRLTQQPQNPGKVEQQVNSDQDQTVENSDLTQQVEDQQLSINGLETSQRVLTSNQNQFVQRIEDNLINQVRNAIRTKYNLDSQSGFSTQQIYEQLVGELPRNITNQLQKVSTGSENDRFSYITYNSFTTQQLIQLKKRIENDIKQQLQREVSLLYRSRNQLNQEPGFTYENPQIQVQQQLGQTPIEADLTQQVEDDNFGNTESSNLSQQRDTHGSLQFGKQDQLQQSTNVDILNEQFDGNTITSQQSGTITPLQIPSANLQFNRGHLTRKPIDSNTFINREIDQQHQQHSLDANSQIYGNSHNLPTLNHVIQQTPVHNNKPNTEVSDAIESLGENNQVNVDQQVNNDLTDTEHTRLTYYHNPQRIDPAIINQPQSETPQIPGQAVGVTSQGRFLIHAPSVSDAERDADLLIQKLREHTRNNPGQSQQSLNYIPYEPVGQEVHNDGNRYREQGTTGSSGHGYRENPIYIPYNQRVSYGHPGQAEENIETISDLQPIEYQQANTIQNVESPTRYNNIGVKGYRRLPSSPHAISVLPPVAPQSPVVPQSPVPPVPPQSSIPPQPLDNIPPQPLDNIPPQPAPQPNNISPQVSLETPAISQSESTNGTNVELPWWKRVGKKFKDSAQNFKEKYIG